MNGLWKKLDHEKSNRRDKTYKTDYRENFAEPASQAPEKRQFSIRVTKSGVVVHKSKSLVGPILRKRALENFRRRVQSEVFVVHGRRNYRFAYTWAVQEFADQNGLDLKKAEGMRSSLKGVIKQKRQFAEQRINRAQVEEGYDTDPTTGLSRRIYQLSYRLDGLFSFPDGGINT